MSFAFLSHVSPSCVFMKTNPFHPAVAGLPTYVNERFQVGCRICNFNCTILKHYSSVPGSTPTKDFSHSFGFVLS